uniref:Predicted protein n=1 Tax=Hordeum vulgare subsp. vulgare TaxID=112509 RepID=F2CRN5_HORVV|nr:predicted protein [Hordeum vulgare subsp. vulgare]
MRPWRRKTGGTGAGSSRGRRRKTSSRSSCGSDGAVVDGGGGDGLEARVSGGVGDSSEEKGASLTDSSRFNQRTLRQEEKA